MNVHSLNDIPPEILSEIFSFLDPKTLLLCSSVCHLWLNTVKSSPELQYILELWADGMVPGTSVLTGADALEALYRRRRAWKRLEWTSRNVVEIESLFLCRAYELVAGLFIQQQQGPDFLTISLANLVDDSQNARATRCDGIELSNFEDFAIDPTQDLIVRFYTSEPAYLDCRTMSSHEPHPRANHPVFTFSLGRHIIGSFYIQIVDDIVAIFFSVPPCSFHLFNWRAGFMITEVKDEQDVPFSFAEFHLLSSRSYVFAHAGNNPGFNSGQIDIFTFDGDCPNSPTNIAILELPPVNPKVGISSMIILAGPFCANAILGTPFTKANQNRIYMFLICYDIMKWCRLFVHWRWLHGYVIDHVREKTGPTIVPWKEWGPQNTRMLPGATHQWNRHIIHGERVVLACENRKFVQVYDFGIIPQRMPPVSQPTAEFKAVLHTEPSTLVLNNVFQDIVTTSLPYMHMVRLLDEEYNLFLMDQDRILAMNSAEDSSHRMTVYTF
ncbi:F-box domain-containing protein [Mycena sanguinolenta]|uniref:F-box domain-containing protein n=1 Tax=Mycena sanguinolenta TaxID=230812 RepID=A0A8H6YYV8_9AGAR|nr:F-box domain-containing protein [Mycena sanguinolenta]